MSLPIGRRDAYAAPVHAAASLDSKQLSRGAIDKIAQELSTTQYFLQIVDDEYELEFVRNHRALDRQSVGVDQYSASLIPQPSHQATRTSRLRNGSIADATFATGHPELKEAHWQGFIRDHASTKRAS
jgi:hypothetical protein